MKIAIPTESGNVSEHFGRALEFTIVDIKNNKIVNKEVIPNPGHVRGFIPKFLHEKGVKYVITGGIGWRAIEIFKKFGVEVIVGVRGRIEEVLKKFIEGKLVSGESLCKPGAGKGYGIEREDDNDEV